MRRRRSNGSEKKRLKPSCSQRSLAHGYQNVQRRPSVQNPRRDNQDHLVWLLQATSQRGGNDKRRKKPRREPLGLKPRRQLLPLTYPLQELNCLRKPQAMYHPPGEVMLLLLVADLRRKPHPHLVTRAQVEERHQADGGLANIRVAMAPRQAIAFLLGLQTPCVVDLRGAG